MGFIVFLKLKYGQKLQFDGHFIVRLNLQMWSLPSYKKINISHQCNIWFTIDWPLEIIGCKHFASEFSTFSTFINDATKYNVFYIFVNATLPESTELLCKNRSTIKWTFIQFLYEWHGQLSALRRSHVRFRRDVYVEVGLIFLLSPCFHFPYYLHTKILT